MKTATCAISTRLFGFGLLILAACLLFAPPARAGLTFEVDLRVQSQGQSYYFVTPLTPTPGYYVATGHFRYGILLAPITAQVMADVINGVQPAFDLAPFSPARFASSGPLS